MLGGHPSLSRLQRDFAAARGSPPYIEKFFHFREYPDGHAISFTGAAVCCGT